jgi:hypothetical protein
VAVAAHDLEENADRPLQLETAILRSLQKLPDLRIGRRVAPLRRRRCRPPLKLPEDNGNNPSGRDHWATVYSTVLAGGGVQGGQVYGKSDKLAAEPKDKPRWISLLRSPPPPSLRRL